MDKTTAFYPPCKVRVGSIVTTNYYEREKLIEREITEINQVKNCSSGWTAKATGGKGGKKIHGTAYMETPAHGIDTNWFTVVKY
jgi:hypothetical protein